MEVIDPSLDRRWDVFVRAHPEGTIFHTSNWARVIQQSYGFLPYYIIQDDAAGGIRVGLPFFLLGNRITGRRLVSLPFTDRCAPLFSETDNSADIAGCILAAAKNAGADSIEIRSGICDALCSGSLRFSAFEYYQLFLLDLGKGLESIWSGFKQKSVRYPIKKAESSAVTVRRGNAESDMRIFHRLNTITRHRHGVFPQPYRFFENIYHELVSKGLAFLLIAEYRNRPIAASIFFTYRDSIHYKYNCSSGLYAAGQPNHLLLWHAIKEACEKKFKFMDFGRTAPDNAGLVSFKRHWGTMAVELPYYYYPGIKKTGGSLEKGYLYKAVSSLLKKMPVSVLERFGRIGYKYFA